jgi:RNA polymerase sigma-70 factor (ECF subfamily)
MERYQKSVYFMILKMVKNEDDAEDLTIEAFSRAFKYLPKFEQRLSFSAWLFRIATNNCVDFLRKKKKMGVNISTDPDSGNSVAFTLMDKAPNPHELASLKEKYEHVRDFVALLPEKYRILIELRYFRELAYEEISKEVDIPLGTTKARLHRAKELLSDIVKDKKDIL